MEYRFQAQCRCGSYTAKPRARFDTPVLTKDHKDELQAMINQHQGAKGCQAGGGDEILDNQIWCFRCDDGDGVDWENEGPRTKKAKLSKDLTVNDVTAWIASDRVTNNELVEINLHLASKLNANLGCVLDR